jgi:hypothetical protein
VVAVGPGREYTSGRVVPIDLRPGDLVAFKKWADVSVFDVRNQDRTLVAVSQEEVLCVLEPVDDGLLGIWQPPEARLGVGSTTMEYPKVVARAEAVLVETSIGFGEPPR